MKILTVRFIESINNDSSRFTMEYKGLVRWASNTIGSDDIYGNTKEECLNSNLEYMRLNKNFVRVIEHSTVKVY